MDAYTIPCLPYLTLKSFGWLDRLHNILSRGAMGMNIGKTVKLTQICHGTGSYPLPPQG